jgi:hypothetical protein
MPTKPNRRRAERPRSDRGGQPPSRRGNSAPFIFVRWNLATVRSFSRPRWRMAYEAILQRIRLLIPVELDRHYNAICRGSEEGDLTAPSPVDLANAIGPGDHGIHRYPPNEASIATLERRLNRNISEFLLAISLRAVSRPCEAGSRRRLFCCFNSVRLQASDHPTVMVLETFKSIAPRFVHCEPREYLAFPCSELKSLKFGPTIWHRHAPLIFDASRRRILFSLRLPSPPQLLGNSATIPDSGNSAAAFHCAVDGKKPVSGSLPSRIFILLWIFALFGLLIEYAFSAASIPNLN